MIGIFNITNSKLESWTFGVDFKELKGKVIRMLNSEECPSKREELKEVINQLAEMNHAPAERTQLTRHYHLVSLQSSLCK